MAVILIVEDDAFIRVIAERMMQGCGHQTLSTDDVDAALVLLRSPQPIDVLFTDIRLQTAALAGFELARAAIELRPKLRVLYTTGAPLSGEMKALFVESARFLAKPYVHEQLQASVEDLLAVP